MTKHGTFINININNSSEAMQSLYVFKTVFEICRNIRFLNYKRCDFSNCKIIVLILFSIINTLLSLPRLQLISTRLSPSTQSKISQIFVNSSPHLKATIPTISFPFLSTYPHNYNYNDSNYYLMAQSWQSKWGGNSSFFK